MWAEYCDIYRNNSITFLEAIEFMKLGNICEDSNGHRYKIKGNRIYHQLSYNNWIECLNYEIPTAGKWYLLK